MTRIRGKDQEDWLEEAPTTTGFGEPKPIIGDPVSTVILVNLPDILPIIQATSRLARGLSLFRKLLNYCQEFVIPRILNSSRSHENTHFAR